MTIVFFLVQFRFDLLPQLIACCRDSDSNTRKFACFAIGNAAFHNDTLYFYLRPAFSSLVALLSDVDEKTRANSAGAIGNLARNSDSVVVDLLNVNVCEALLQVITKDDKQPRKIAIFSLGNLCNFPACRQVLRSINCVSILEQCGSKVADPSLQKSIARIIRHLS